MKLFESLAVIKVIANNMQLDNHAFISYYQYLVVVWFLLLV